MEKGRNGENGEERRVETKMVEKGSEDKRERSRMMATRMMVVDKTIGCTRRT